MRWVLVLAVACGCTQTPPDDPATVVQTFCDCLTPGAPTACVAELSASITMVTDACMTCVYDNESSCTALDANCFDLCFPQEVTHGNP